MTYTSVMGRGALAGLVEDDVLIDPPSGGGLPVDAEGIGSLDV